MTPSCSKKVTFDWLQASDHTSSAPITELAQYMYEHRIKLWPLKVATIIILGMA